MDVASINHFEPSQALASMYDIAITSEEWLDRPLIDFHDWLVMPLNLGQVFLAADGKNPVAFMTWAFLGEDQIEKVVEGYAMTKEDWNSGPAMWCVDMVAKPGYGKKFVDHIKDNIIAPDQPIYWWRPKHGRLMKYENGRVH